MISGYSKECLIRSFDEKEKFIEKKVLPVNKPFYTAERPLIQNENIVHPSELYQNDCEITKASDLHPEAFTASTYLDCFSTNV